MGVAVRGEEREREREAAVIPAVVLRDSLFLPTIWMFAPHAPSRQLLTHCRRSWLN